MAPQPIHILPRDGAGSPKAGLYIAGFVVAGLVTLGAAAWLTIRFLRQRARANDEDNRGASFLNVRGLVREGGEKGEDDALPKYGYERSTIILDLAINSVLTGISYFPIIAILMVSKAICSRGPI